MIWTTTHEILFWIVAPIFALAPLVVPIVVVLTVLGVWK